MAEKLPPGVFRDGDGFYAVLRLKPANDWMSIRVRKMASPDFCLKARSAALDFWDDISDYEPSRRVRLLKLFLKGLRQVRIYLGLGGASYIKLPKEVPHGRRLDVYAECVRAAFDEGTVAAKRAACRQIIARESTPTDNEGQQ